MVDLIAKLRNCEYNKLMTSPQGSEPSPAEQLRAFKAEIFKLLAHPTRIHILEQLRVGEQPVSSLISQTGVGPANLSQHLSLLRARGLVQSRREGGQSLYHLSDPALGEVLDSMRKYFATHVQGALTLLQSEADREESLG